MYVETLTDVWVVMLDQFQPLVSLKGPLVSLKGPLVFP